MGSANLRQVALDRDGWRTVTREVLTFLDSGATEKQEDWWQPPSTSVLPSWYHSTLIPYTSSF